MGNLSEVVKKDDKVQVFTTAGDLDPNIYIVTGLKQRVVEMEHLETKVFARVHKSRIAKILLDKDLKEVQEVMDKTAEKQESKTPKAKKPKAKPERVNFKKMIQEEKCEVWSKGVDFTDGQKPVDGIKVESHCVIAPDLKSYRVFNTYNGTMGKKNPDKKKNPLGVSYPLKDDKALEKKRKDLEKKGYKKRKK
jgi:hypothetical protein